MGQCQLVLTLECLGTDVSLVVTGVTHSVTKPARYVGLCAHDIGSHRGRLSGELIANLGNLAFGPAPFTRPHRKGGSARMRGRGHCPPPSVAWTFDHQCEQSPEDKW